MFAVETRRLPPFLCFQQPWRSESKLKGVCWVGLLGRLVSAAGICTISTASRVCHKIELALQCPILSPFASDLLCGVFGFPSSFGCQCGQKLDFQANWITTSKFHGTWGGCTSSQLISEFLDCRGGGGGDLPRHNRCQRRIGSRKATRPSSVW